MTIRPLSLSLVAVLSAGPALAQTETAPDRVGRIAAVTGTVSFHLAGATEWQVATRNLPVTTGLAVWSAPAAEATLDVSGSRIVLGSGTELDVDRLDAQTMATTQPQGETYWHLRAVAADTYVVHTPRGTVTLATDGRYAIVSGDTDHPTTITVLDGSATLTDGPDAPPVVTGQELTITGDGATNATASLGPVVEDAFLRHALAEEAPRPPAPRTASAPAIVAQMTGADALDDVGRWTESAEYGPVWYPPAADYVPYRQGNWAYVAPWGWTWVDAAPWGFAPSHYGRWSRFDGRWGWVPGRDWAPGQAPVYAPALVGFIGGAALGISVGAAREQFVGWAPLGPREAYRPSLPGRSPHHRHPQSAQRRHPPGRLRPRRGHHRAHPDPHHQRPGRHRVPIRRGHRRRRCPGDQLPPPDRPDPGDPRRHPRHAPAGQPGRADRAHLAYRRRPSPIARRARRAAA